MARASFEIGTVRVRPGLRQAVTLPITRLVTGADVDLPIRVVHGREDGPTIWVNAAIHGDEAVGVEVIRQVLADLDAKTLRGTVIAIPIVNVLGFMNGSRYLPDRRDLNRSFPGSARGSLAGRIAHLMMTEVVDKCTRGHRPAHRLRPPHQPAPDPHRPRGPRDPQARRRLRGPGDAARPAARRLAAPRRPRARRQGAALRGRRGLAHGRLGHRRRRRRRTSGAGRPRHDRPDRRRRPARRAPRAGAAAGCAPVAPAWCTSTCASARRSSRASGSAGSSTPSAGGCG